jgi:hypothetical protein
MGGVSIGPSAEYVATSDNEGDNGSESEEVLGTPSWAGDPPRHSLHDSRSRDRIHVSRAPPLIVFDEQRIVTSLGHGGVDIWHFDL